MPPGHAAVLPRALRPGDTIAFVSPSLRLNETHAGRLGRAARRLEARGFRVKVFFTPSSTSSPTDSTTSSVAAADLAARKRDLLAAFADAAVAAVVCTYGGSGATELLAALRRDPGALAALRGADPPKVFVGYSDVTVLHWLLASPSAEWGGGGESGGLRTFYGPTAIGELGVEVSSSSEGEEEEEEILAFTLDNLLRAVCAPAAPLGAVPRSRVYATEHPAALFSPRAFTSSPSPASGTTKTAPSPPWTWLGPRTPAEGPLFGGCLPVVVRLHGVPGLSPPFSPPSSSSSSSSSSPSSPPTPASRKGRWAGHILLLETPTSPGAPRRGYPPSTLRRDLADLAAQGALDGLAGLVVGRCHGHDGAGARREVEEVVREVVCDVCWGGAGGGDDDSDGSSGGGGYPILMHVDVGHTAPMVTLPLGARARLDPGRDEFVILEAGVRD